MVYVHTMETPADAIDKGKMRINVYDKQQGTPLADAGFHLHIQEILKELSMR